MISKKTYTDSAINKKRHLLATVARLPMLWFRSSTYTDTPNRVFGTVLRTFVFDGQSHVYHGRISSKSG